MNPILFKLIIALSITMEMSDIVHIGNVLILVNYWIVQLSLSTLLFSLTDSSFFTWHYPTLEQALLMEYVFFVICTFRHFPKPVRMLVHMGIVYQVESRFNFIDLMDVLFRYSVIDEFHLLDFYAFQIIKYQF